MSDEDLVVSYLDSQDDKYFSIIYQRYSGKVYGKCLSFFKNDAEALDAVQDVFIKLLVNIGSFKEKSKFSTWVYAVTYNYCIDVIRKNKNLPVTDFDVKNENLDFVDEVDDHWITQIDSNTIEKVMDMMNEGDKAILLMKYMDELSIKDISGIINKTESAVKMQLKRAKSRFKLIFSKLENAF
ncbi:MAG: sigma-70 family RNA polymerase sigma factor [Saprospiraceae bacterium]|nr:sigma-70 family RNA polymerase sigma factor [Saprospiraceae bacterium]